MYGWNLPQHNINGYGGGHYYPGMNSGRQPYPGPFQPSHQGREPYPGTGTMTLPPCKNGCGDFHQTMVDSYTGNGFAPIGSQGYGLDFNGNGRYDRGRDGVLVFDMNRDGRMDTSDVQSTNDLMKAAAGDFDFNKDGRVSMAERMRGAVLRHKFQQLDRNRDGRLSSQEIARGGGGVWMDSDRNGMIGRGEMNSVFNVPANGRFGPRERLDFVDPFRQNSHTSNNPQFPCYCPGSHNGGMGWSGNHNGNGMYRY